MSSAEFFTILSYVFSNVTSTDEKRSQSYQEVQQTIPACPADDSRGRSFTAQGPPEYKGKDILEDPDLLWLDDADWDEDRVKAAEMRISDQGDNAPQFWREKYVREANKYWHIFYKRNTDHFYKDRHYLHVIFPELLQKPHTASHDGRVRLLEVGCGVGNAILPLPALNPSLTIHAIDFAASAIQILRSNPQVVNSGGNILADVCDIVNDEIPVGRGTQDLVLCMFVLSAVSPQVALSSFLDHSSSDAQEQVQLFSYLYSSLFMTMKGSSRSDIEANECPETRWEAARPGLWKVCLMSYGYLFLALSVYYLGLRSFSAG
jgi:SAM-dependent methyltransferase